jgi:asparagine synthase (glutamine-hydrolysing)
MFKHAKDRFPHNTPGTKEAYYSRMIFERFYPLQSCLETIPGGPSVACSTAKAIEWDEEWKAAHAAGSMLDQSGRAVKGVHDDHKQAW